MNEQGPQDSASERLFKKMMGEEEIPESIDPASGVITSWNTSGGLSTRRDTFPNFGPKRVISIFDHPGGQVTTTDIKSGDLGIECRGTFISSPNDRHLEARIAVQDFGERDTIFQATYNNEGELSNCTIELQAPYTILSDPGTQTLLDLGNSYAKDEDIDFLAKLKLSHRQQMQTLTEIYQFEGNELTKHMVDWRDREEGEMDVDEVGNVILHYKDELRSKGITPDTMENIVTDAQKAVKLYMDAILPIDVLDDHERVELANQLGVMTAGKIMYDTSFLGRRPPYSHKQIIARLGLELGNIIGNYRFHVKQKGDTTIRFTVDSEDKEMAAFEVVNGYGKNAEVVHSAAIPMDTDAAQYERYVYGLHRIDHDMLTLHVASKFDSEFSRRIYFPERVNIDAFEEVVTTEEPTGWERGLHYLPIKYFNQNSSDPWE